MRDILLAKAGRAGRREREGWQIWAAERGGRAGRQAGTPQGSAAHLQDVVCGQAVVAPPLAPRHADGLSIEQRAIEGAQVSHLCGAATKGAGKVASGWPDVARRAFCGLLLGTEELCHGCLLPGTAPQPD